MKRFYHERDRFNRGPNRYVEVISNPKISKLIRKSISRLQVKSDSINYLDLGCGNCQGTELFANFLRNITRYRVKPYGIDIVAPPADSGIPTLCIDLNSRSVPFNNHFHIMTLFETIEHIFNVDFMLESANSSLVKQGIFIVTTLNIVCWKNRILVPLGVQPINTEVSTKKLTYGYKFSFLKKYVSRWKPSGHIRPFTIDSLAELLTDNNFKIVHKFGLENWRPTRFLERIAKSLCTGVGVIGIKR